MATTDIRTRACIGITKSFELFTGELLSILSSICNCVGDINDDGDDGDGDKWICVDGIIGDDTSFFFFTINSPDGFETSFDGGNDGGGGGGLYFNDSFDILLRFFFPPSMVCF